MCLDAEWVTGAEDFSFFGEKAPSFFFFVGGMPKGKTRKTGPASHARFFHRRQPLDVGVKAFCNIVLTLQSEKVGSQSLIWHGFRYHFTVSVGGCGVPKGRGGAVPHGICRVGPRKSGVKTHLE